MASYVAIANLAASKVGSDDQIREPDDDTHVARSIKAVWDIERQAALRDHKWNFALKRTGLAAEALDVVPYPWGYSYPLPADCLRLIEVLNGEAREHYQLEGRSILADVSGPLYIRYVADVVEPALWDHLFTEVMACRVALAIGKRIAGTNYDRAAGDAALRDVMAAAKRSDARENPNVPHDMSGWELARFGGASSSVIIPRGWNP